MILTFDHLYKQAIRTETAGYKTLAAEYSLRPSPEAAVSAPVTWEELARVYPTDFDIDAEPERLLATGDLWADILSSKQDLKALIEAE